MLIQKLRLPLFLILACCYSICSAQNFKHDYKPLRHYRPSKALMEEIAASYKRSADAITVSNKKAKLHVKTSINTLSRSVTMRDSIEALMHSDTLTNYLNAITNRIQSANSHLSENDYHVFTYRTSTPNASNAGLGVLMINLDLISKLNSEQELAFIICHEIAHDILQHVLNGINDKASLYYQKEFQEKLKELRKQEYNRLADSEKLFTSLMEQFSEHSRVNELEADSIGLMLFCKAGYAPAQAVKATLMLDSVDYPVYFDQIRFTEMLSFPAYPFKNEWLAEDESHLDLGKSIDWSIPDNLKTHPSCIERAQVLERIIESQKLRAPSKEVVSGNFNYYMQLARFEEVEMFMYYGSYGEAMFTALQMLPHYPENTYLKCVVANSLYEILRAMENHKFSKAVDTPDDDCTQSYYEFLRFLHNLSNSELKEITFNYYEANLQGPNTGHPYAGYVKTLIKSLEVDKAEYASLIEKYESKYDDPWYTDLLKKRLNQTTKKK